MKHALYNTLKYIDYTEKKPIILSHKEIISLWNELRDFKIPITEIITY